MLKMPIKGFQTVCLGSVFFKVQSLQKTFIAISVFQFSTFGLNSKDLVQSQIT